MIKTQIEANEILNEANIGSLYVIESSAKEIGEIIRNMNKPQRYYYFKKKGVSFCCGAEAINEIIMTDDCKYMIHCIFYADGIQVVLIQEPARSIKRNQIQMVNTT